MLLALYTSSAPSATADIPASQQYSQEDRYRAAACVHPVPACASALSDLRNMLVLRRRLTAVLLPAVPPCARAPARPSPRSAARHRNGQGGLSYIHQVFR